MDPRAPGGTLAEGIRTQSMHEIQKSQTKETADPEKTTPKPNPR